MTREEAAEFTRKLLARAEIIVFPKTPKTINHIPVFYFETVLSALRGSQPDPDTGLVPCGCGCKPELRDDGWGWHQVYCTGCDMHGGNSHTPDGVIEEWNTAMGWKGGAE